MRHTFENQEKTTRSSDIFGFGHNVFDLVSWFSDSVGLQKPRKDPVQNKLETSETFEVHEYYRLRTVEGTPDNLGEHDSMHSHPFIWTHHSKGEHPQVSEGRQIRVNADGKVSRWSSDTRGHAQRPPHAGIRSWRPKQEFQKIARGHLGSFHAG